ncbi:hypothetical protein MNSC_00980 [Minisyncoccus archaeophilus]
METAYLWLLELLRVISPEYTEPVGICEIGR